MLLDTLIEPGAVLSKILPHDVALKGLCTAFDFTDASGTPSELLLLIVGEPPLFNALNDLILAITIPHHSVVNCARSIEGIRRMIALGTKDTKQAWSEMRTLLNLSFEFLDLITTTSAAPRHGDRSHISGEITTEIIRRAWAVMNRFLEFRKRGNRALPLGEFPKI